MDEVFKIDVFIVEANSFVRSSLDRARRVEVLPGRFLTIAAPETIVIEKLRWYRLGNMVSDRQWNDIVQVIEIQGGALDRAYISEWAAHFELSELLLRAESEAIDPGE